MVMSMEATTATENKTGIQMNLKNTIAAPKSPSYTEIDQRESGPLDFGGWAHVSGRKVDDSEVVGYNVSDYFAGNDGTYSGPDQHGIYPALS